MDSEIVHVQINLQHSVVVEVGRVVVTVGMVVLVVVSFVMLLLWLWEWELL